MGDVRSLSNKRYVSNMQHATCNRSFLLLVACCLLLSLTGCVTRSLTIKSEPPGAKVYVNDQLKGETPMTYDFEWYGWHRVILRKDGYQRLDDRRNLRAPPHLWIPLDLAMELLPLRIRDNRTWSYTLVPEPVLPTPQPPAEQSTDLRPQTRDSAEQTESSDGAR